MSALSDPSTRRLFILRAVVVALVITLLARLWFLQVASGKRYTIAAASNGTRTVVTTAVRGEIIDDEGSPLVQTQTALEVSLDRSILTRQKDGGLAVLQRLAPLVSTPDRTLTAQQLAELVRPCDYKTVKPPTCNTGSPYQPVPVASFLVSGAAGISDVATRLAKIQEDHQKFPGVLVTPEAIQIYPQKDLAAQILGYTGKATQEVLKDKRYVGVNALDVVGRAGLEEQYDNLLRGVDGKTSLAVDAAGNVLGQKATKSPVAGGNLVLNLNSKIQAAAQQALAKAIKVYAPKVGAHPSDAAAVVMTTDGRVLALASYPTFDANVFNGGLSVSEYDSLTSKASGEPLLDRATDEVYPPGSTWKVVTGSALLAGGVIDGKTIQSCPPSFTINKTTFGNFEGESFGPMDLDTALTVSCDTFFYQYAYQQWLADGGFGQQGNGLSVKAKEILPKMAKAFGFGSLTGIDLPHEASGQILDREANYNSYVQGRSNFCKGADLHKGTPRGQADAAQCTDGWRYNAGDLVLFAIGQGNGVSVTPLQEAAAYAAIANGGTLYQPTLARGSIGAAGEKVSNIVPRVLGKVPVSSANLAYIRQALRDVATKGTASGVFGTYPIAVAGKTGTAEVDKYDPTTGKKIASQDQAWFASFAPADDPKYVVLVTVPDSQQGANVAAPAVRDIYNTIFGVADNKLQAGKAVFGGSGLPPEGLPCVDPSNGAFRKPQQGC